MKHIIAWTFADYGFFIACTLYKHSEFGTMRFVYEEGMVIGEIIQRLLNRWTSQLD